MRPTLYTKAVILHFTYDPDMPETVREWYEEETDPRERADQFAACLQEDLSESLLWDEDASFPEHGLHNEFVLMAMNRVNWRQVAKALLDRFRPRPGTVPIGSSLN